MIIRKDKNGVKSIIFGFPTKEQIETGEYYFKTPSGIYFKIISEDYKKFKKITQPKPTLKGSLKLRKGI